MGRCDEPRVTGYVLFRDGVDVGGDVEVVVVQPPSLSFAEETDGTDMAVAPRSCDY